MTASADDGEHAVPQQIEVLHRTGQWCPGLRLGEVIVYEMEILPEYRLEGGGCIDRCFVLPQEGVQLRQPVTFPAGLAGGWYVDLIELEARGEGFFAVHDLWVDILVPPRGRRYEILDLHDLAAAIEEERTTPADAARILRQTQAFVDRHLFDPLAGPDAPWPDFPPAVIQPLLGIPLR